MVTVLDEDRELAVLFGIQARSRYLGRFSSSRQITSGPSFLPAAGDNAGEGGRSGHITAGSQAFPLQLRLPGPCPVTNTVSPARIAARHAVVSPESTRRNGTCASKREKSAGGRQPDGMGVFSFAGVLTSLSLLCVSLPSPACVREAADLALSSLRLDFHQASAGHEGHSTSVASKRSVGGFRHV